MTPAGRRMRSQCWTTVQLACRRCCDDGFESEFLKMSAAAAAAAARRVADAGEEETPYTASEMAEGWEFILRSVGPNNRRPGEVSPGRAGGFMNVNRSKRR
jgi:hypothetical protein